MIRVSLLSYLRIPHLRLGLFLAACGSAAVVMAWMLALQPARAAHDAARAALIARSADLAALEARRALADRYFALLSDVDALERALAAAPDRSQLVESLTSLSARAGTRIIHGSNSLGDARDGLRPMLQELTVEGGYDEVRAFLTEVSGLDTLTLPVAVDLNANPDGTLIRGRMRLMTLTEAGG